MKTIIYMIPIRFFGLVRNVSETFFGCTVDAKDRRTGVTFAAAVSMKGGVDPHAARLLAKWIDGLGCQEVTVRTDGVRSICELIRRDREIRAEGTTAVDEISPPGDSVGNGIAERAILAVGGLVRTTKAVFEESVLEGQRCWPA